MGRRHTVVFLVLAYVVLAFAHVWPQSYGRSADWYVAVSWVAFLIRVFEFHIALVVAVIGLLALVRRRWRVALFAAPVVLLLILPTVVRQIAPPDPPAGRGPTLRVMTINLLVSNEDTAAVVDEIDDAHPDVVVFQEYDATWHDALRAEVARTFPHVRYETRSDSFGAAIYSRKPFIGAEERVMLGHEMDQTPETRNAVDLGGTDVAIYNIHTLPPSGLDYTRRGREQFADLLQVLRSDDTPRIVAGDFNVTADTPQHDAIGKLDLVDAWDLAGRGRGATWPANSFLAFVPGVRLDHLYLSEELTVMKVRRADANGSDHRPVIADVRLRD